MQVGKTSLISVYWVIAEASASNFDFADAFSSAGRGMSMNPVVIIPTYISSRGHADAGPVISTYDHTTALAATGELPRCLESLRIVRGLGQIIILVAAEPAIENKAASKVRSIAEEFSDLNIAVVGAPEMALVRQRMDQLNISLRAEIGLSGYGSIRNLGLLLAGALDFDSAVFVDDDVVVDDPAFLEKAMYGLGKLTRSGVPILAKTGFYLNKNGSYLSSRSTKWYNRHWDQATSFNKWISKAMAGPRLSRSNHVCGGCLALHRETFRRVSFDPWIARGEDLDYMLDLRMYGSDIWFDNTWYMHHLPPAIKREGLRFRQDIFRWLYEYRKIEYARTQIDLLQIKSQSLLPYPGPFLEPGITKRIKRTALLRSIGRPDGQGYRRAARAATGEASRYAEDHCSRYFGFQAMWPAIMERMANDAILQSVLLSSSNRDAQQAANERAKRAEWGAAGGIDPGATTEIRLNMGSME